MSTLGEHPHFAPPDGVLRRLTLTVLAWLAAGAVVVQALPTVLTPLPLDRLATGAPPVVARTPVEGRS